MMRMVRYTFQTGLLTGTATVSIQIPGTFVSLLRPQTGGGGRLFVSGTISMGSPAKGDYATGFKVVDNDGVIPSGLRGNFPNYPVISDWSDPGVSAGNVGIDLETDKPTAITPMGNNNFCPSGLYLTGTVQKASVGVDTVYVDIQWDDLT